MISPLTDSNSKAFVILNKKIPISIAGGVFIFGAMSSLLLGLIVGFSFSEYKSPLWILIFLNFIIFSFFSIAVHIILKNLQGAKEKTSDVSPGLLLDERPRSIKLFKTFMVVACCSILMETLLGLIQLIPTHGFPTHGFIVGLPIILLNFIFDFMFNFIIISFLSALTVFKMSGLVAFSFIAFIAYFIWNRKYAVIARNLLLLYFIVSLISIVSGYRNVISMFTYGGVHFFSMLTTIIETSTLALVGAALYFLFTKESREWILAK